MPALRRRAAHGWILALILVRIAVHTLLMSCAIPDLAILAWYRAILLSSQRSSGSTYALVSSWRIAVALYALSTIRSPWFWYFCILAARPLGLLVFVGWCHNVAPYAIAGRNTA